jgi:hypothetical protein
MYVAAAAVVPAVELAASKKKERDRYAVRRG